MDVSARKLKANNRYFSSLLSLSFYIYLSPSTTACCIFASFVAASFSSWPKCEAGTGFSGDAAAE